MLNVLCSCTIMETSLYDFKTIETLFMMFSVPNRLKTNLSKELIEVQKHNSMELMKQIDEKVDVIVVPEVAKVPKQNSLRSLFKMKKFHF